MHGKGPKVQEIGLPMKQTPPTRTMIVSSKKKILFDQLKEFIKRTTKDKDIVDVNSSLMYKISYIARIDSFKIPVGYKPSEF